ncbi:hypothetical protein BO70DRAFT_426324 [Aspergillus heteromorphus CBS 117.55]|uniref:Sin3 associated polypeptide p18 n=1 Tax=Aspergillus heteromorphus CBS 117.55 TaxID=1448321 RepID=A0A317WU68_9EURO|nr:uncharacterized protein BO70DRAFT_426324 [Aspergillus heteromorphus CBS 117.55]PWY89906.1 hypothetical protein BO70DRAFT_426324 [Aspergillus heteromorphus CBS 117.55]
MAARPPTIDRQSTTPFHLKLFYRLNNYHHLSDFAPPSPSYHSYHGPTSGPNAIRASARSPPPATPSSLPPHLQIYTWQSCTLRELSQLLTSALPNLLPSPSIGTRICFRLIYPDTKGAAIHGPEARGRYLARDLGSVVVGEEQQVHPDDENAAGNAVHHWRLCRLCDFAAVGGWECCAAGEFGARRRDGRWHEGVSEREGEV